MQGTDRVDELAAGPIARAVACQSARPHSTIMLTHAPMSARCRGSCALAAPPPQVLRAWTNAAPSPPLVQKKKLRAQTFAGEPAPKSYSRHTFDIAVAGGGARELLPRLRDSLVWPRAALRDKKKLQAGRQRRSVNGGCPRQESSGGTARAFTQSQIQGEGCGTSLQALGSNCRHDRSVAPSPHLTPPGMPEPGPGCPEVVPMCQGHGAW